MPKRRKSKLYKTVNVATKNVGSAGGQVRIGVIDKIDAQGMSGYLNNVRLSVLLNDPESIHSHGAGGFIAYLTTSNSWNDDYILTATAGNFADTVNLTAKRRIVENANQTFGNQGQLHLWVELTDISLTSDEIRYVAECWGNFIAYEEV